ncbi:two-component system sensor kinase [Streptomyces viridochromogenes DSM 40736]|uniref:Oxygen sensor histidine kinase NreB n=1 Tax=Streptomyces viridochromogenes (strain DSM 40736 / JCM 4977 / BCRC 1201 / Tue 494) TaxID=591159 RepID=D9X2B1_STRVT|nr:histidine kinase [Streptomyces viridochromogenes]EFL33580.1 two-component system sensor kinase [Streptomyces viridochromogenes DSM 40736]
MGGIRGDLRVWWQRGRALGAANPLVVDIGLALLVQAAMTMPFVVPRAAGAPPATWGAYGLSTLTVVPLVWRRRAPVGVLFGVLATSALYGFTLDGPGQPLPYTGLVVVYTIGALSSARKRLATGVVLLVAVPVGVWLNTRSARELTFSLFVFAAAYGFGRLTDARQRANRVEAEQAAARERARIAREMHDVLSHAVSLMIVQAEAGPVAVRAAPERAEAAFDAISAAGRDAMAQLRQMLGVLRDGGDEDAGAAPREPQPGLTDLPDLLERVRAGGLEVRYGTAGIVRPLPGAVAATVFRVVQEALTNTVRHADARTVAVRLTYGDDDLSVRVTDDGRGPQPGSGGSGHGLAGIRERAAAHGGSAMTGRGADGRGFEVLVRLPVPAPVEAAR